MRRHARSLAFAALVVLPAAALAMGNGKDHGNQPPITCPADIPSAVATECPCAGTVQADQSVAPWRNHGQYQKCVVHFRNALRKAGCFTDDSVRRAMARCAAHSTCGKDRVLCCTYDLGTCSDPTPNGVAEGTCSNDATHACDVAADCTKSAAHIVHDTDACAADQGVVVVGGGSVCQPCPPPAP
jgi:hypothetical protein